MGRVTVLLYTRCDRASSGTDTEGQQVLLLIMCHRTCLQRTDGTCGGQGMGNDSSLLG